MFLYPTKYFNGSFTPPHKAPCRTVQPVIIMHWLTPTPLDPLPEISPFLPVPTERLHSWVSGAEPALRRLLNLHLAPNAPRSGAEGFSCIAASASQQWLPLAAVVAIVVKFLCFLFSRHHAQKSAAWRQGCTWTRSRGHGLCQWESWDYMLIRCVHKWDFTILITFCAWW